ncbi:MAG TPA: winged helix-turn-helix transcriptional regulator [Candidatus Thermoplasmatota archaeon]|nr:winged helix-turn-helix transcriptional regulator [Candidatus Thermoplasmatota archaeon]
MAIFAHKLLTREEVLDNELRKAIMEHLSENPGSYLGKISRELNVPTSTLKYHLNILRSFDLVSTVRKGRCRHYFPKRKRFTDVEKKMYAAIEHGPTRRIVQIIAENPGISQGGLVQATGLSQSTVAWHMAKLEEMNLIRSERNDVKEYHLRSDFREVLRARFGGDIPAASAPMPMEAAAAPPSPFASMPAPAASESPFAMGSMEASPFAATHEPPEAEPQLPPLAPTREAE